MDDGEVEISENFVNPSSDSSSNVSIDELLRNAQTCTHTHTCNPPGPDAAAAAAHTHTCFHTHTTQLIQSGKKVGDVSNDTRIPPAKPRRPSGNNREAVRKYREKKKAHTAYLEEEVEKLRVANQELLRKVQRQAILEVEISRLKGVLVDLRGKIDDELGSFLPCDFGGANAAKEGAQYSAAVDTRPQCSNCFPSQEGLFLPPGDLGGCNVMGSSLERNCVSAIADCRANANARETAKNGGLDSLEIVVSSASQEDE